MSKSVDALVMDYETLSNCFVACFESSSNSLKKSFVIGKLQNDIVGFLKFLEYCQDNQIPHISFNGLAFDSQITEFILRNKDSLLFMSGEEIAKKIYSVAQELINLSNAGEFPFFPEWELKIPVIDVYKINHWDNLAKKSSLKWIQFTTDWYNIQEMPISHTESIISKEQLDTIKNYCFNDVSSCKHIYLRSLNQIDLRKKLTEEFEVNLINASEPSIAKKLFLKFLSEKLGVKPYTLKTLRTDRSIISVKDIILPYINFKNPKFNKVLEDFKKLKVDAKSLKGAFKNEILHKDVKTVFGLGGIHGAVKNKIVESDSDWVIVTADVVSFYPNLAIRNKWSPAHLDKAIFCEQYEWFFDERVKIPKKDPKNYVYKIILNSTYGLSNEKNSFLYDPEFTLKITINGQLLIALLYDMIEDALPDSIPLMQNTDGLETYIKRSDLEKYYQVTEAWEKLTGLVLEHDFYSKMLIWDVNNYIAIFQEKQVSWKEFKELNDEYPHYAFSIRNKKYYYSKTKTKGRFDFIDLALHKDKSFLVIPKAIYNFFVKGIDYEKYITENCNIFDFCAGAKIKGTWEFRERCVGSAGLSERKLQKVIRYYISKKDSCKIIKKNTVDGREIQEVSGVWLQKVVNNIDPEQQFSTFEVDKTFYIKEVRKEINNLIEKKQYLFDEI